MAVLLLAAPTVLAETAPSRPAAGAVAKRTYVSATDGASVEYALWVPKAYDPAKPWPLIVFLHGSGEGGRWDLPTQPYASIPVKTTRSDLPFLVVFPLMRGSVTISGLAERDVLETLDDVRAHFNVDDNQVHLTGLSFGGFAAWQLACHYPDRFATLSAFCGGGQPELAANLRHLPTRVVHGMADNNVPIIHSTEMVDAMKAAKLKPDFNALPGVAHVCWERPYADPALYRWMEANKRVTAPNRITYKTLSLRYAGAYWATILTVIDPTKLASIDVFAPGNGQVMIHAENVGRLLLNPPPSAVPAGNAPVFVADGKRAAAEKTDTGWLIEFPGAPAGPLTKRPGLSGPIQDVFQSSFTLVLPTMGDPQLAAAWAKAADFAMAWTKPFVYKNVPRVTDAQVTAELMARTNLICFGDAASNQILAKAREKLPLVWEGDRLLVGDQAVENLRGMVMIYPNPLAPDRYLVVCSGHPGEAGQMAAIAFTPPPLGPTPLEDLLIISKSGRLPLAEKTAPTRPSAPRRMNARLPQRDVQFDSTWQLTPAARDLLLHFKDS